MIMIEINIVNYLIAKWQQEQDKLKIDNIRSDEAFKFELKSIDKFSNGYDAGYEEAEKRSYSEEEVLKLLNKSCNYIYDSSKIGTDKKLMPNLLIGWFEQFKKK